MIKIRMIKSKLWCYEDMNNSTEGDRKNMRWGARDQLMARLNKEVRIHFTARFEESIE